ncbi:MAG: aminoglycoside 3'-phosphotransferase [Candidatus Heimdallarchaeota archaeon]|nr:aminoglycoside 3'-phosphotransferase [Candidatus Heimdallarchaeota archaeon]MCK4769355.1 aminoglycoside 3'-phosphotransferase [Candidatus Heimdallarchaeota archaeon]
MSIVKDLIKNLPKELQQIIEDYMWEKNTMGWSGTKVFKLTQDKEILYLKINEPTSDFNLEKEKIILEWLAGKLPVPEVIYFEKKNNTEYLLLSEIRGIVSHKTSKDEEKRKNITILAEGLKKIHSINPSECPIDNNPDKLIELARARLKKGKIDSSKFDKRWSDKNPEQLFEELEKIKPKEYDLVFSHGDYCLPNVLVKKNQLSGIIDWPYSGINERYFDLGAVTWSIGYNYGEEWVKFFFEDYGIEDIDWEKIFFFQMLNEFFQQ